jgi:hypothetical protein
MRSHRDIIALWPSSADLARDINVPADNVRKWKAHNRIPGWHFADLVAAAERRGIDGVSADVLALSLRKSEAA